MTGDRALLDALAALNRALRDVGAPSMIIGGIAVIARGVPRATRDIDATIWGQDVELDALFSVLGRHGHVLQTWTSVVSWSASRCRRTWSC